MRTNVYLTVDTEHSMGGAWANAALHPVPTERRIFCRIAGKDHGIGWLCEELGKRNFRATFFAEMSARSCSVKTIRALGVNIFCSADKTSNCTPT